MIRVVVKCPDCGKKPWIRPGDRGWIMGCCMMYAIWPGEIEARSTWNEMAAAKWRSRIDPTNGSSRQLTV